MKIILLQFHEIFYFEICIKNFFHEIAKMSINYFSMYAQRYFTPEDKEQLFEMTQYLRKAFSGMLDDLDWMDESTRVNI